MLKSIVYKYMGYESGPYAKILRVAFKSAIMYCFWKLYFDGFRSYMIPKHVGMTPRFVSPYSGSLHNPIPPIPPPYDPDILEPERKQYNKFIKVLTEMPYINKSKREFLYSDHPQRENPDAIDQFVHYADVARRRNLIQLLSAKKLESEGGSIGNVNMLIRKQQQEIFNKVDDVIIPKL